MLKNKNLKSIHHSLINTKIDIYDESIFWLTVCSQIFKVPIKLLNNTKPKMLIIKDILILDRKYQKLLTFTI